MVTGPAVCAARAHFLQRSHGCLRLATSEEVAAYDAQRATPKAGGTAEERAGEVARRALELIQGKSRTTTDLAARLRVRREVVIEACGMLEDAGVVERARGGHSPWQWTGKNLPGTFPGTERSATSKIVPAPPFMGGGTERSVVEGSLAAQLNGKERSAIEGPA